MADKEKDYAYERDPGYYAILPSKVRYDKSLNPMAKIIYGEITALCNELGYCWASNNYFARRYDVNRSSVSRWIKNLADSGYIRTEFIYKDGMPVIDERRIFLCEIILLPEKLKNTLPAEGTARPETSPTPQITNIQEPEEKPAPQTPQDEGGGAKTQQGGDANLQQGGAEMQRGGAEMQRGGANLQERILNINIKYNNKAAAAPAGTPKTEPLPSPQTPKEEGGGAFLQHGGAETQQEGTFPQKSGPPPVQTQEKAATASFTHEEIQNLKNHFLSLDPSLAFDPSFYPKLLGYLASHGLDFSFVSWLYRFSVKREPRNLSAYLFTIFCKERYILLFREATKPKPPEPPPQIVFVTCPACGANHNSAIPKCPACGLEKGSSQKDVDKHKRFLLLPMDKRDEFFKKREEIWSTFGMAGRSHVLALEKEFGLLDTGEAG